MINMFIDKKLFIPYIGIGLFFMLSSDVISLGAFAYIPAGLALMATVFCGWELIMYALNNRKIDAETQTNLKTLAPIGLENGVHKASEILEVSLRESSSSYRVVTSPPSPKSVTMFSPSSRNPTYSSSMNRGRSEPIHIRAASSPVSAPIAII